MVVLDIMLPGIDGVEVCRRIRDSFSNPVLMLTAKDDDLSEVASLNTGADGYLNKPVRPHVLWLISSQCCVAVKPILFAAVGGKNKQN